MTKDRVFPTFATLRGRTSTVELLLMKGASIEAMNKARKMPMQYEIIILVQRSYFLRKVPQLRLWIYGGGYVVFVW